MGDTLGKLVRSKRVLEQRTTKQNASKIISELNKYSNGFGFEPLPKNATVKEVNHAKKIYDTRLAYDIVTKAINEGNTVIASTYNVDLKKSDDRHDKRIAEFAPKLAQAKKFSDRKLTKAEKGMLDNSNQHIRGYGNEDMITEIDKLKTNKQFENFIEEVKKQDPRKMYFDNKLETFERTFQKIESVREEDVDKLRKHLSEMSMEKVSEWTTVLLATIERFYNDREYMGKFKDEEQELANARLDDIMLQMGLKKSGIRKVNSSYKKFDQQKKDWEVSKRNLGSKRRRGNSRRKVKNNSSE